RAEAVVAHLDGVAQGLAAELFGQQGEETLEILGVELLGRGELPEDRAETVAQLLQPLGMEALQRLAGLGEDLPVGGEARALHREDEAVRRLLAPLPPAVGLEAGVVGAVDLDGGQMAAGVAELILLLQRVGIED